METKAISIHSSMTMPSAPAQAQSFSPKLFSDFVTWIDRGEKTTRSYLTNLKQFAVWMLYAGVLQPTRQDVISYRQWLLQEHDAVVIDRSRPAGWKYRTDASGMPVKITCRPNTVAQYLRSVCQFFRWTAASGLYPDIAANIHAPKVSHDVHRKDALTVAEVLTIERSIADHAAAREQESRTMAKDTAGRTQRSIEQGKRLFAIYLLAVNAGLRTIEISRANIRDFETKGGQAWLYIWGKGHADPDQKKAIAPEVAAAVQDYLRSRIDHPNGSSPLFVSTGNRSGGRRIAPTTISTILKKAMQAAGYDSPRLTAHSLRHTAGTAVQELTGDIYATQKYMRHSSPATTEIYLHNDTDRQESVIARQLYDLYHGTDKATGRDKLEQLIGRLTPQQVERLTNIVAAMA